MGGGDRNRQEERRREGGDAETAARRGRQYDVTRWEMGGVGGGEGGVELSCRSYQVKPPTSGCHHGDTMVTTRCSTRKEHDLAYVKALPLCAASSLFLSRFRVVLRDDSSSGCMHVENKNKSKYNQQM